LKVTQLANLIAVARGELPADLVLANVGVVNVFTGKVESGNIAVYGDKIAGVGDYKKTKRVIDLEGKYVAPGLINGHIHPESSMLDISQYARAVVPHGISAVVTDLHEIANVCGLEGIRYVLDCARSLPLDIFLMAPSCVPATHLETSGANLGEEEVRRLLRWRDCIGLGEVMNFPGVIGGDENVLGKLCSAQGRVIDGHAPGVSGKNLTAYIAGGIGSDHECVTLEEAADKLRQGLYIMIREGSSEKNLETLLPLVTDKTYKRCLFVVDDRSCVDLLHDGDIDAVVRKAIRCGLNPVRAIQMATINTAEYFKLHRLGAIAPGYFANLIVIDDLSELKLNRVFYKGRLVAEGGQPLFHSNKPSGQGLTNTMNVKPFGIEALKMQASGEKQLVIEVVPGQIITHKRLEDVRTENGVLIADLDRDILKAAVVERHTGTGNIGLGLVKGFGLKKGALASSIAHDSHNIVVVGTNDDDMLIAIKEIERMQGGLVAVADRKVLANLALPVAGLLSDEPLETVVKKLEMLEQQVVNMGSVLPAPFAVLSFLALPVIPELRLTDMGMVDVNAFKLIK